MIAETKSLKTSTIDSPLLRVFLSAVSGGAGSFLAALGPLVTTPIMLSYLGDYRYGLWMLLLSVTALVGLSDFGITNGITTELSHTGGDSAARRKLISNAYAILALVSIVLLAVLAMIFLVNRLTATSEADHIFSLMIAAVLAPTILSVPLGFIQRLLYIDMRGVEASMAPGLAAILSVAIAVIGSRARIDPYLLMFLFLATVPATYGFLTLRYFHQHRALRPASSDWDAALAWRILGSGRLFVLLSLLVVLCSRIDYVIVVKSVGVINLVPYSIADRVIGIANSMVTVLGASLWPVFAKKVKEGDIAWIRHSIIRVNIATLIFYALFTLALVFMYDRVLVLWLGSPKSASTPVLILLCLTSMAIALTSPYFALANSVGAVKEQIIAYVALLLIGFPIKFAAGLMFGTVGVAAGAFGGWAFVMLPIIIFIALRRLRALQHQTKAMP